MNTHRPRVSIGLPVFNGERYVESALKALLAQTFADFEIIISDNASTDRTGEICQRYAAKDCRIHYYRNAHNLGAAPNFNRTVALSSGEYFKWACHDDLCLPEYLARCVEVLDRDPSVVLCHSRTRIINDKGSAIKDFKHHIVKPSDGPPPSASAFLPEERFNRMIYEVFCYPVFGLMRLSALKQTRCIEAYAHGDGVLLARLALLGRYHEIPQLLFLNRDHPGRSDQMARSNYHTYATWFDSKKTGRIFLPYWRMLFGYLQAIWETPLSLQSRFRCHRYLWNWTRWTRKKLVKDLKRAMRELMSPSPEPVVHGDVRLNSVRR